MLLQLYMCTEFCILTKLKYLHFYSHLCYLIIMIVSRDIIKSLFYYSLCECFLLVPNMIIFYVKIKFGETCITSVILYG